MQFKKDLESRPESSEDQVRLQKVADLRARHIEPWPQSRQVNATVFQILDEFRTKGPGHHYKIAGRVMAIRHHGKASFVIIQDVTGRLQLYVQQDVLGQAGYELFQQYLDTGDIIWATGESFLTKTGQPTLKVEDWCLMSKSLHALPEKFHGLTDIETIYRQRYLDLIVSADSRARFICRTLIIRTMRQWLDQQGFLEVETPMLHPIPGGAAARPFVTHHNALDEQLYLRIAPELYLKRLVIGGFDRVYEINRSFRNEGVSTRHNPEFTTIELYLAYHDYHYMMDLIELLMKAIVQTVCQRTLIKWGNHDIDFSKPFARKTIEQAVCEYGRYSPEQINEANIDKRLEEHQVKPPHTKASWGEKLFALFEKVAEHQLIQPTFITQYPVEVSPLAKRDAEDPRFAARFELFIVGMEFSNGFNELNDPFEQAERFKQQLAAREAGDVEAHHYDADYVQALEYGLPPTVGMAIGIDRLTMLLTNAHSIKDVILFPTLKRKE